jgi:hypothetical protein
MSDFVITIDDKDVKNWLKKAGDKVPMEAKKALNNTALFTKRNLSENLPKRSGLLRKSYQIKTINNFSKEVGTSIRYAHLVEEGGIRPAVYPKRAKRLTIPINDKVLVGTKSQISKSSLNFLFKQVGITKNNVLYSKVKGQSPYQGMQKAGIILAKKSKQATIKGTHTIKNKVLPKVQEYFNQEIKKAMELSLA